MEESVQLNEKASLINEKRELPDIEDDRTTIMQIKGYIFAFTSTMSNASAVMALQAIGSLLSLLLLQTVISFIYFFGSTIYCITSKESLRITSKKDFLATIAMAVGFGMYRYFYFMSAYFLSPSTTEGMFTTGWMVIALFITLFQRRCEWHMLISAVICVIGIILLSQPEGIFPQSKLGFIMQAIPCNSFITDNIHLNTSPTTAGCNSLSYITNNSSISVNQSLDVDYQMGNCTTNRIFSENKTLPDNEPTSVFSMKYQAIGYFLNIASSCFIAVYAAGVQYLQKSHGDAFIAFWSSALTLAASIVISGIFWTSPSQLFYAAWPCYIILIAHCFFAVLLIVMTINSLTCISQAEVALVSSVAMVFLYISQLTFMSGIHPGRGNVLELIGAIEIIIGNVVSPFWVLFCSSVG